MGEINMGEEAWHTRAGPAVYGKTLAKSLERCEFVQALARTALLSRKRRPQITTMHDNTRAHR